jgi:hypothetical protein
MGLDIFLSADNDEALRSAELDWEEYHQQFSLSRSFCNLMHRRNVVSHQPELDQLGELVGLEIEALYEMMTYPKEEDIEWQLEQAKTKQERQQVRQEAEAAKARLQDNLDRVQATVDGLLNGLASYDNLPARLDAGRRDTLNNATYFAYFGVEASANLPDYVYNFGKDLRTVQRFLAFARSHGSHTIYFEFW